MTGLVKTGRHDATNAGCFATAGGAGQARAGRFGLARQPGTALASRRSAELDRPERSHGLTRELLGRGEVDRRGREGHGHHLDRLLDQPLLARIGSLERNTGRTVLNRTGGRGDGAARLCVRRDQRSRGGAGGAGGGPRCLNRGLRGLIARGPRADAPAEAADPQRLSAGSVTGCEGEAKASAMAEAVSTGRPRWSPVAISGGTARRWRRAPELGDARAASGHAPLRAAWLRQGRSAGPGRRPPPPSEPHPE